MKSRFFVITLSVALLATTEAFAGGALHTPVAFPDVSTDQVAMCTVANVGTSDAEVTVTITSIDGTIVGPDTNTCPTPPATLAAGDSCFAAVNVATNALRCSFVGKAKMRAGLAFREPSGGATTLFVPATAK